MCVEITIIISSSFNIKIKIFFVYPPEEVPKCQGFKFCVTDGSVSFFDIETPPIFSNNGIIERVVTNDKVKNENNEDDKQKLKRN